MSTTLDITQSAILAAFRGVLLSMIPTPAIEIVKGQVNQVAAPKGDFIVFWPLRQVGLGTNIDTWAMTDPDPTTWSVTQPTQWDIQADFHGPRSADLVQVVRTLWRDEFTCEAMRGEGFAIQPLYCDDPAQRPFITEGKQYEDRWVLTLSLQVNPVVSTLQEFADIVTVDLISVDATYPP